MAEQSLAEAFRTRTPEQRRSWLTGQGQRFAVWFADAFRRGDWRVQARPSQKPPPGLWQVWLILSGRGWGKTRTGAETLLDWLLGQPSAPDGTPTEWAIVAHTIKDAREVCLRGPSGFLNALRRRGMVEVKTDPAGLEYVYNKGLGVLTLGTGQKVHVLGADSPDVGRGLNLAGAWLDELAKWPYPSESWTEGLMPALRIGVRPRVIVTTTPKPIRLVKQLAARTDGSVVVTRGSTFDNASNLSQSALDELRRQYDGTRIGRQELYGEVLEDIEGALWTRQMLSDALIPPGSEFLEPDGLARLLAVLVRVNVAVDPAVTSGEDADETGIVVSGITDRASCPFCGPVQSPHAVVLDDRTLRDTPDAWAKAAVTAYREFDADRIVPEINNGGDLVVGIMRAQGWDVNVRPVRASRGKRVRAEPVSALYQQGRVHHLRPFPLMDDQLCEWVPDVSESSPDRLDALVWSLTDLLLTRRPSGRAVLLDS